MSGSLGRVSPGSRRTSLALTVAQALDRTLVRVQFTDGSVERLLRGHETEPVA